MKKVISMFFLLLLTAITIIPLEAQNKVWPPKSYPAKVSFKVTNSIYYWDIQSVTCMGKTNSGYKFRIKGIGKHDASMLSMGRQSLNIAIEERGNILKAKGAYSFPSVKKGEAFSMDIVSAFTGMYSPARFVGLVIFSDFPMEEEQETSIPEPPAKSTGISDILEIIKEEEATIVEKPNEESEDNTLYKVAETMPEFIGGQAAMNNFISQNQKYPKVASKAGVEGRAIIKFTVCKDGSIFNPVVTKSVDPNLDNEALRIVKMMPKWKAGTHKGKSVNVSFSIPFSFRLS